MKIKLQIYLVVIFLFHTEFLQIVFPQPVVNCCHIETGSASKEENNTPLIMKPYEWIDTIELYNPRFLSPTKYSDIHGLIFLTADSCLPNRKLTEGKLLHTENVYIYGRTILPLWSFLVDTIGIDRDSLDSYHRLNDFSHIYGMIFRINNYYLDQFSACTGRKKVNNKHTNNDYYKVCIRIPRSFYINVIRQGEINIPSKKKE